MCGIGTGTQWALLEYLLLLFCYCSSFLASCLSSIPSFSWPLHSSLPFKPPSHLLALNVLVFFLFTLEDGVHVSFEKSHQTTPYPGKCGLSPFFSPQEPMPASSQQLPVYQPFSLWSTEYWTPGTLYMPPTHLTETLSCARHWQLLRKPHNSSTVLAFKKQRENNLVTIGIKRVLCSLSEESLPWQSPW